MSFDKYSDKAAEAIELIREFAKVECWDFFKGDPEQALEAFCAMQDVAEEMGRMKAQDNAVPQDNVPGVYELPSLPVPIEVAEHGMFRFNSDQMHEYARAALRAYGQRAAVAVPQWISIEDRLPAYDEKVLAICNEVIGIGYRYERRVYGDGYSFNGTSTSGDMFKMSHWMPLPAVPGAAPSQPQQEAVPAERSELDALKPNWTGKFETFQHWVNKAQSWLKSPSHCPAICIDAKGRRCSIGADFMRARDEGAFPVWFFWDCEPEDSAIAMSAAKEPS